MKKRYAVHVEYNDRKNGYIESYTEYHLTKDQALKLIESEKESERDQIKKSNPDYDFVKFELFELTPEFNEWIDELWSPNSEFSKPIERI